MVLGVVVSFDVVMMFHRLAAVVHAVVVVVLMVGASVSRVVRVLVFQTDAQVGALEHRRFRHDLTVGRLVVAVVKVADRRVFALSLMLPIRYQDEPFLCEDVDTLQVTFPETLHDEQT